MLTYIIIYTTCRQRRNSHPAEVTYNRRAKGRISHLIEATYNNSKRKEEQSSAKHLSLDPREERRPEENIREELQRHKSNEESWDEERSPLQWGAPSRLRALEKRGTLAQTSASNRQIQERYMAYGTSAKGRPKNIKEGKMNLFDLWISPYNVEVTIILPIKENAPFTLDSQFNFNYRALWTYSTLPGNLSPSCSGSSET